MGPRLSSFLVFLSLALSSSFALNSKCVPDFNSNPKQYDNCLRKDCFIFRTEKPYVFLDEDLNRTNDQVPFRCVEHKQVWPGLEGVFFDMIRNMPALQDTYCVFAGRNCSFNGMVRFVNSSAASRKHRWIAGGVLFVLQDRILPGIIPSTSIIEDYLHIVGPPRKTQESFQEAFNLVLRPFTWKAWLVFFSVLVFFGIVRVVMVYIFGNTIGWAGFLRTLFLFHFERDVERDEVRDERDKDWWRILQRHWGLAFIIFTSIMLLLYEVALAVIAFEAVRNPSVLNLQADQFVVYENTTEEYFFRLMVKNSTKYVTRPTLDEVYKALEYNNNLTYTVSYGVDNRYKFTSEPELCETLRLYDTVPATLVRGRKPPPITGVWFYSRRIPAERRMEIDKAILKLKELGRISSFVDMAVGGREVSSQCKPGRTQIGWFILFMLVALPILYLIGISIAIAVAHFCYRRANQNASTALPLVDPSRNAPSASSSRSNRSGSAPGSTISGAATPAPVPAPVPTPDPTPINGNNAVSGGLTEARKRPTT